MKAIYFLLVLICPILCFSQTEIYFKYDEAGNQRYRGNDINGKQAEETSPEAEVALMTQNDALSDELFWNEIRIYPVPVKDILTIEWTNKADALIDNVSLYQHNSLSSLIQQKNYSNINRQVRMDMSSYYMGVYILSFQLKDGRTISRNITKQ